MLNQERIRELLDYNPETGALTWRVRKANCVHVGDAFGTVNKLGYRRGVIDNKSYHAHRLIWLWMTGAWPTDGVDHLNGDKIDNRWANLRNATVSVNTRNQKRGGRKSATGVLGVTPGKAGRFRVTIRVGGKNLYFGTHDTIEQAAAVYIEKKKIFHPDAPER